MHLFNNLPRRCVVLLEDIDSAGLLRDPNSDKVEEQKIEGKSETQEKLDTINIAQVIKSATRHDADETTKGISLSGLLNAIDGVASHEGRALIMTSNHPDALDDALIRPGRVDMKVAFTLASREQARDIFVRMYTDDRSDALSKPDAHSGNGHLKQTDLGKLSDLLYESKQSNGHADKSSNYDERPHFTPDQVAVLADTFANQLEDHKFSPAEIQGFLLMRKKDPTKAIDEVASWSATMLEAKEKKVKVLDVN